MRSLFLLLFSLACHLASAASCEDTANALNQRLNPKINAVELAGILTHLNRSGRLPDQFVTKKAATAAGWRPGSNLHATQPGKSIGGDRFGNYEKRLPGGQYTEADLDYRGGKRGAKRFVFSRAQRFVTVDHYNTFLEVPPCQ
ncbi:MAG: putative ribonuclease precursor [Proteobacteria bacterium]|nr:putative ribonuclease precursor [Pseudomonadota bacterium]